MIEAGDLRRALGRFPTGVAIVTAAAGGEPAGMTVNSFSSVSLDPPLLQFSIDRKARSLDIWKATQHFAVHILAEDQIDLSNRFARSLADKWTDTKVAGGLGGAPVLEACLCVFECAKWAEYDGGDHLIFLGRVERLTHDDDARTPLVFHRGNYRRLAEKTGSLDFAEDALLLHGW
ncbi:flavin reductase family protein [Microbaculum marinum]|uniref:Flavin reductase family protein n=1 Tax=Microbaculum marinum TaxID=1764581 RepID=A0AAW9RFH5_9HYPH